MDCLPFRKKCIVSVVMWRFINFKSLNFCKSTFLRYGTPILFFLLNMHTIPACQILILFKLEKSNSKFKDNKFISMAKKLLQQYPRIMKWNMYVVASWTSYLLSHSSLLRTTSHNVCSTLITANNERQTVAKCMWAAAIEEKIWNIQLIRGMKWEISLMALSLCNDKW